MPERNSVPSWRTAAGAAAFASMLALLSTGCLPEPYEVGAPDSTLSEYLLIWQLVDRGYACFCARPGVDWDAAYLQYRTMALEAEDREGLVEAALLLLGCLQDANVALFDAQGVRYDSHDPGRFVNFDDDVWLSYMQELLPEPEILLAAYGAGYFETAGGDSIGYAYLSDLGDAYWMEDFYAETNDVRYCAGLIIDLRMCGGSGTEPNARSAVGRFVAQGAPAYLRSLREGPGRYDMTEPVTVNATKNGAWQFTGPTVVLTGRGTSGAAELLVLLLASQEHVTLVGDTTAGFANPGPRFDLTEGWSLEIPSMMTYDLSMGAVFDRGIPPDIPVPAAPADFAAGVDPVLDAALGMLAGKPGVPPRIR